MEGSSKNKKEKILNLNNGLEEKYSYMKEMEKNGNSKNSFKKNERNLNMNI